MSKFIVTVFDNESSAYEGSRAIKQLHEEGNIVVYAAAVISKDNDGMVQIKDAADEGPIGTATGMMLGTLLGGLGGLAAVAAGGPAGAVAVGMAAGAAGGGLGGFFGDMYNVGVDAEFLDDVGRVMTPGKFAVVAEVAEGWTAPLDTRMEELGGIVFRRYRIDVEDAQIERDIEATNRELDELEAEWDQAVGEAKDKLKAKVDAARARMESLKKKADDKIASMKAEADAKIATLDAQIAKASGDAKAAFEKRRDELKADYERRSELLKKAGSLTAEALS